MVSRLDPAMREAGTEQKGGGDRGREEEKEKEREREKTIAKIAGLYENEWLEGG